jgi:hypothetical protein
MFSSLNLRAVSLHITFLIMTVVATGFLSSCKCVVKVDEKALPDQSIDQLLPYLNQINNPTGTWLYVTSIKPIEGGKGGYEEVSKYQLDVEADLSKALSTTAALSDTLVAKVMFNFSQEFKGAYENPTFYACSYALDILQAAKSKSPVVQSTIFTKLIGWGAISESTITRTSLKVQFDQAITRSINKVIEQLQAEKAKGTDITADEKKLEESKKKTEDIAVKIAASYERELKVKFKDALKTAECDHIELSKYKEFNLIKGRNFTSELLPLRQHAIKYLGEGKINCAGGNKVILDREQSQRELAYYEAAALKVQSGDALLFLDSHRVEGVIFILDVTPDQIYVGISSITEPVRQLIGNDRLVIRYGKPETEKAKLIDIANAVHEQNPDQAPDIDDDHGNGDNGNGDSPDFPILGGQPVFGSGNQYMIMPPGLPVPEKDPEEQEERHLIDLRERLESLLTYNLSAEERGTFSRLLKEVVLHETEAGTTKQSWSNLFGGKGISAKNPALETPVSSTQPPDPGTPPASPGESGASP